MIYIITSLYFLITNKIKYSVSKVLFTILLLSSIAAYFVGRQPTLSFDITLYVIYNVVLLYILFSSFKNYGNIKEFCEKKTSEKQILVLEKFLSIIGILILILNIYILYNVMSLLILGTIDVQGHKNDEGASIIFSYLVPDFLITLSNLFSPLGYFFLSLHFYYIIKKNIKKSILFLLLSFLLPLSGFLALSRSSTTQYILLYFTILIFIFPIISRKIRTKIIFIVGVSLLIISTIFLTISKSRFSERYTKNSLNSSIIDNEKNPLIFSSLDYFSQWEENAPIIMKNHKPEEKYWGLYNSSGLAVHIQKIIYGKNKVNLDREKEFFRVFGYQQSNFHGNIARLVYDFGFFGTIIFILLYSMIIKSLRPYNRVITFKTLLFLPVILPFCVVFFTGNALSSLPLNLGIIYSILIYYIIRINTNVRNNSE